MRDPSREEEQGTGSREIGRRERHCSEMEKIADVIECHENFYNSSGVNTSLTERDKLPAAA